MIPEAPGFDATNMAFSGQNPRTPEPYPWSGATAVGRWPVWSAPRAAASIQAAEAAAVDGWTCRVSSGGAAESSSGGDSDWLGS